MATTKLKHIKRYRDRHGRWRNYFRKPGAPTDRRQLPSSLEFLAAYQQALSEGDATHPSPVGTVTWLVSEFLASTSSSRPLSMQSKLRKDCEDFARDHGWRRIAQLETEHLEKLFWAMKDTPSKANQWRKSIRDLLSFDVKRKVIAANPAAGIKDMPERPNGHHTWTPQEVEAFRATHAIGTQARLAFEIHNALALRRSDAILLGPAHVQDGVLTYVQAKNRNRKPIEVSVPMPADLMKIIAATSPTGTKTWLVNERGRPFAESSYSHWFSSLVKPLVCHRNALRMVSASVAASDLAQSGATTKELASVTGHRTLKEVERYTEAADRKRLAVSAMSKRNKTSREIV